MATTAPALGYGQRGDAPINAFNQWLRTTPQYQSLIQSFGQNPNNVHLNDDQKQQVIRLAQSLGAVVDEGHDGQEVDDSGNFQAKSHKLRNTLIVAGIAGAALLTAGAAGAFGGAAAGGGSAASAGGAAAAGGGAAAGAGVGGGAALAVGAGASAIPWGDIFKTGAGLFGNLFAAHEQSSAADRAAELAAAGSKYSADLQAKANADALAFQKDSAENSFLNNEAARKGNYGVFAARERRLGTLGEEVGLGPREIPDYAPGVDPRYGSPALAPTVGEAANSSSGDPVMNALLQNYASLGVKPTGPGSGPTDIAYMYQQAKSSLASGERPLSYWLGPNGRIAAEIAQAGGGGAAAPKAAATGQPGGMAPAVGATPFMNTFTPAAVPQAIGYYA